MGEAGRLGSKDGSICVGCVENLAIDSSSFDILTKLVDKVSYGGRLGEHAVRPNLLGQELQSVPIVVDDAALHERWALHKVSNFSSKRRTGFQNVSTFLLYLLFPRFACLLEFRAFPHDMVSVGAAPFARRVLAFIIVDEARPHESMRGANASRNDRPQSCG